MLFLNIFDEEVNEEVEGLVGFLEVGFVFDLALFVSFLRLEDLFGGFDPQILVLELFLIKGDLLLEFFDLIYVRWNKYWQSHWRRCLRR